MLSIILKFILYHIITDTVCDMRYVNNLMKTVIDTINLLTPQYYTHK